jgi:hypothetical protein
MGPRYLIYRIIHLTSIKSGYFRKKFPTNPSLIDVPDIELWRKNLPPFFFYGKNIHDLKEQKTDLLHDQFKEISEGIFTFFGKVKFNLGIDYDWITNPVSGFKYDINKHWSIINELTQESGDIKFVWEKARFSFLQNIIRYDYHYNIDCSEMVFSQINSFIDKNPINRGPNYICSQEISIRILNWTLALYYYKDSKHLTQETFRKIITSIYWQINHVYQNINFSRIAVRNNHAVTETLMLYLSGLLFPFLPDVKQWSRKGKKWFEKEIVYQIYDDGTYLQFSNNYHRVVIQLLTWGIRLAQLNKDEFKPEVISRAKSSLVFLIDSMDLSCGMLPNYGANDGALFFNLNDHDYRDYRPQLQALSCTMNLCFENVFGDFIGEDLYWMGLSPQQNSEKLRIPRAGLKSYPTGGYYLIHDNDSMTYLRCGNHKDRPSQADNMHLDIWYRGINFLRDSGSYLYNSDPATLKYFMGTSSHNTVMLGDFDQMLKGPRFTWFAWSQSLDASLTESVDQIEFEGLISAFTYIDKKIRHRRKVTKFKGIPRWLIQDEIIGAENYNMNQLWHFDPAYKDSITLNARDGLGKILNKNVNKGWYSSYYGIREPIDYVVFSSGSRVIITELAIKL